MSQLNPTFTCSHSGQKYKKKYATQPNHHKNHGRNLNLDLNLGSKLKYAADFKIRTETQLIIKPEFLESMVSANHAALRNWPQIDNG